MYEDVLKILQLTLPDLLFFFTCDLQSEGGGEREEKFMKIIWQHKTLLAKCPCDNKQEGF